MLNQFFIGIINMSHLEVRYRWVRSEENQDGSGSAIFQINAEDFEIWKNQRITLQIENVDVEVDNAYLNENFYQDVTVNDHIYHVFISDYGAVLGALVDSNGSIIANSWWNVMPTIQIHSTGSKPEADPGEIYHEVLTAAQNAIYTLPSSGGGYSSGHYNLGEYDFYNNQQYASSPGDGSDANYFQAIANGFDCEIPNYVSRFRQSRLWGAPRGWFPYGNAMWHLRGANWTELYRMYQPNDIIKHMSLLPRWKARRTDAPSYGVVDGVYYPEVLPTNEFTGRLITGTSQQLLKKLRKWQYEEISEYNKYSAKDLPPYGEDDTGKRYLLTRGLDKTISVLMDKMNLQFTHTQEQDLIDSGEAENKWIRLLMPKYTRRVEIEDLNRNFWVISQVIAAVCAKLFDEQNEIPTIMKDITNELTQLWENTLYLWATLALQNQKISNRVHTEMVPIEVSKYQNFNKYDFDQNDIPSEEEILERLAFYPKKYQQNLCIIPYLRLNNYKHNYYSGMKLLGIYLYHYNTNTWKKVTLKNEVIEIPNSWEKKLYGIREVEEQMNYEYAAPFSEINKMEREAQKYFYCALRVVPDFRFKLKSDSLELFKGNGGYYEGGFEIYDAARETALNDQTYLVDVKQVRISDGRLEDDDLINDIGKVGFTYRDTNVHKYSMYFGEVISRRVKCAAPVIQNADFKVIKIGDFYPKIKLDNMSRESTKRNCFSLIPEHMETLGENKGYDWATYGIGSYHINNANWDGKVQITQDNVVQYINYNHFYDTSNNLFKIENIDELTPNKITELGRQYIEYLRTKPEPVTGEFLLSEDERNKPAIYATRIGVAYWTGDGGSVWNSGIITDLYFAYKDGDVQVVKPIGKVYMFDGYWTGDTRIFSTDTHGSRYRRLNLSCDSLSIRDNEYSMTGGKLVWYDHNKDINNENQPIASRPHADMNLIKKDDGSYDIEFSNFQNPIDSNLTKMAIRINIEGEDKPFFTANVKDKYYIAQPSQQHPITDEEIQGLYRNSFKDGTWDPYQVRMVPANDGDHFYLRES